MHVPSSVAPGVLLYSHQNKVVNRLRNGSILWGGVGTGKTLVAAEYYGRHESPKDIFVITTAKKRDSLDWEKDFARYSVGKTRDSTIAGVLTVDSWNNISKYTEVKDGFFIFDEQRLVGSGVWVKSFLKIAKHNSWLLLTATPGDTWLDYIPVFVAHGFYKNRTEFKRHHVVYNSYARFPKVDRYLGETRLKKLRDQILVEMPYQKHTVPIVEYMKVEYDQDLLYFIQKKRWNPFKDEPLRNKAEMLFVMRQVVGTDPSRLQKVKELLIKHPCLIVFYQYNFELDILRTLGDQIEVSEWNGQKHEDIPDTDRWLYLVQYTAGAEGWNCTSTDAVCFYSLTYSYKQWHQAHGRIDRLDTPYRELYYYILNGGSGVEKAVLKALREKRDFNASQYVSTLFNTS